MRFFTYGRKSVYRDNSDSIDNQNRMCREYCEMRFPGQIDSWVEFSDEDFTGANTNRPDFQRMMAQIRNDLCDVLVVYQLDRFSRDVKDFSIAYEELHAHNVRFICLDLNIDTSTPIGEAMMYVSAAFGQMERKNIALRVADNMQGLAKKGYWTGGPAPTGYAVARMETGGKKHSMIVPTPEGIEFIKWLFDYWLSGNYSAQSLETEFKNKGIKTPYGRFFYASTIHKILTSPIYSEATGEVYDYFAAMGCNMADDRERWDGSCGVMLYGRVTYKDKKAVKCKPEEWVVCIGVHKPILPAETWLAAQKKFTHREGYYKAKYEPSLLKGVLRCSCGWAMKTGRKKVSGGKVLSYYLCSHRAAQGKDACDRKQIYCEKLDEKVLEVFSNISADPNLIMKYVSDDDSSDVVDIKKLKRKAATLEGKIGRLAASLALAENSTASRYIISEMEKLDEKLRDIKKQITENEYAQRVADSDKKKKMDKAKVIKEMMDGLSGYSAEERNEIVRSVVKECTWDGDTLFIML